MGGFAVAGAIAPSPEPQAFAEEPTPFWDAVRAGQTDAIRTRTDWSAREEVQSELWARHRDIERLTRRKIRLPESLTGEPTAARDPVARFMDQLLPVDRLNAAILGRPGVRTDDDYEREISALKNQFPTELQAVETREQIMARVDKRLRDIREQADRAEGVSGKSGVIVGEVAGALMDPPTLGTTIATGGLGAGRSLVMRMLAQGGAGALTEGLEAPRRMEAAEQYGGPEYGATDAAADVGASALGGAAFEAAGAGLRAGWRAFRPATDVARGLASARERVNLEDLALGKDHDGADFEAGLGALDRGEAPPPVRPDRDLSELFTREARQKPVDGPYGAPALTGRANLPEPATRAPGGYNGAPGARIAETIDYRGRAIHSATFDPRQVGTDPAAFQYKAAGDAEGVTDRLRGVEAWDPTASGKVIVYEDAAGRMIVADGHQRRALALRMADRGFDAQLDGYLFRAADGWSAPQVRVQAALKNIREGSGSPLDAAKVFRDAPEALSDRSLPVTGEFIAQARGLARLSPEALGAVVNRVIPERYAAEIGALAGDRPDLHAGMVRLLKDGAPANQDEARALVQESLLDDFVRREGDQADMFGGLAPEATTIARAKVKAAVLRLLRSDARLFGQLVKHADAIETGGNVLARDANEAALGVDRAALELVSKLSLRAGDMGEAMAAAARRVTEGAKPAEAARAVLERVRRALAEGEDLEGFRMAILDPPQPTAIEREALNGFEQPGGRGAADQVRPKPEDAQFEAAPPPGLFDDLPDEAAPHAAARERLAACAPG